MQIELSAALKMREVDGVRKITSVAWLEVMKIKHTCQPCQIKIRNLVKYAIFAYVGTVYMAVTNLLTVLLLP